MERNVRKKGNLMIFGTAFLWSFLGIITKTVSFNGLVVAGSTSLMALAVLILFNRGRRLHWNGLAVLTGVVAAAMNLSFFLANKYTTVANAIVLQYCSPVFVLLYYRFFQKRRLKKQQVGVVGLCLAGLVIFFANQLGSGNMFGNLLALFSGVTFAGCFYLNALPDNDPVCTQLMQHGLCALAGLGSIVLSAGKFRDMGEWGIVLAGGLLCSGMAAELYAEGIQRTTALNANLIAMSEVIMAPLWSFVIFHEALGGMAALGAGLMIVAILYETWFEARDLA